MLDARRTRPVLIALLVVAVALITIDFRDGGTSGAHSIGGRLFGPVEHIGGDVTGWFRGGGNSAEVSTLQQQNTALELELAQARVGGQESAQLARLLNLTGADHYKVVAARVIAAGGSYSDTVTISAGSADGITANETVLNGDGLVGTVVATTATTATVQLARRQVHRGGTRRSAPTGRVRDYVSVMHGPLISTLNIKWKNSGGPR